MDYSRAFTIGILCAVISLGLTSCMRVTAKHYVDGKEEKGFVSYRAVPHLLERPTGNKDNPVAVDLVYLPDPSDRTVIRTRGLIGSAEMGFSLEGDVLKSFNSTVDTKVPETIGSIAALATPFVGLAAAGIGAAAAAVTETEEEKALQNLMAEGAELGTFEAEIKSEVVERCVSQLLAAQKAGIQLKDFYEYIGCLLRDLANNTAPQTKTSLTQLSLHIENLAYSTKTFLDKTSATELLLLQQNTQKISSEFEKLATETSETHPYHTRLIREAFTALDKVLGNMITSLRSATNFRLYRIDSTGKKVIPIPVDASTGLATKGDADKPLPTVNE